MILASCDQKYIPQVTTLIRSCARHAPDQTFYLFLVNSPPVVDQEIFAWHPKIIIEHVWWNYEAETWRGRMCSARSIPLETVLGTFEEKVIYLDSDMIVRGPLDEILAILDNNDLTVKYRPQLNQRGAAGTDYAAKFNNGVIGIRPSATGLLFAQRYNQIIQDYISSSKPLEYQLEKENITSIIDQELLYVTFLEFQNKLLFKPLPDIFNDAKFNPESIIWHGKGTAYKHPIFTAEKWRYAHPSLYGPMGFLTRILLLTRKIKRIIK